MRQYRTPKRSPHVGVDPLAQAVLCLGGLVPSGADPVIVPPDEGAISPL
jgi:hypothetical protein